jgi:hypothetical protein
MKDIAKAILAATAAGAAAAILTACGSTGAGLSTDVIAPAANTAPVPAAAPAPPTVTPNTPPAIDPDRDRGGDNHLDDDINDDKGYDAVDNDVNDNDAHDDHGGHHDR